jgi:hypothetical protein
MFTLDQHLREFCVKSMHVIISSSKSNNWADVAVGLLHE